MNKEFVPHEPSLALKELGFDEPCFGYYHDKRLTGVNKWDRKDFEFHILSKKEVTATTVEIVIAPLYQQAFRWFREKYKIHAEITWSPSYEYEPEKWSDAIYEITFVNVSYTKEWEAESPDMQRANGKQLTHEEAELECLKKLIEIVKNGKK